MTPAKKSLSVRANQRQQGPIAVERLEPPAPGQYWRAIADIKARVDTRGKHNSVEAGTVLMISALEFADGQVHVVKLAPHPSWSENVQFDLIFHAEDFERLWMRELDGAVVRERETDALMLSMRETQDALRQPPPDTTPVALLGRQPVLNQGGETGKELATGEGLQAMIAYAERMKETANKQIAWIKTHTGKLSEQGGAMARFHQERAAAMLAAAHSKLEGLSGILSKVKNLKIYIGEGVKVTRLADGAPAAPDAPITIYQDLLAFDEELLLRLDLGGLDHTMVKDVASALADPAVADQMIPSPRGLVMVQFRGSLKEFVPVRENADTSERFGAAQINAAMNEESQRHRLLYRDGARFFLIECDTILPGIRQLLPSTAEQGSYFERTKYNWSTHSDDAERITPDDIDYAKAQRNQLAHLNDYARVLILLWGLHDRADLFETTVIPKFSNWLDEGFQRAHLRLVSHDSLLTETRPSFSAFRAEHNALLAYGVMVAVNLDKAFNYDSAPTCFRYAGYRSRVAYVRNRRPVARLAIARVRMDAGKPFIDIDTCHVDNRAAVSNARMKLLDSSAYLVLDRVQESDLTHYLTSRSARSGYADYVELFRAAREFVRQREMREAPWHAWLRTALSDGGLRAEAHVIDRAVLEALSVARSSRRSGALPDDPSQATTALCNAILNTAHAALADHGPWTSAIEAWAKNNGLTPLALRRGVDRKGHDEWALYREARFSERDPRIDPFPWVARQTIRRGLQAGVDRLVAATPTFELLRQVSSEKQVAEWADAAAWYKAAAPGGLSHAQTLKALNWISASAAALAPPDALAGPLFDASVALNRKNRTRCVARLRVDFCIGSAIHEGQPMAMTIWIDAMHAASAFGGAAVRTRVEAWIKDTYINPASHLEGLDSPWVNSSSLRLLPLLAVHRHLNKRRGGVAVPPWIDQALSQEWRRAPGTPEDWLLQVKKAAKDKRHAPTRLTSLTPAGARLFPWLIEFCERPA